MKTLPTIAKPFSSAHGPNNLRQQDRATVEDQRIEQASIKFHRGPEPPRIKHSLMIILRDSLV